MTYTWLHIHRDSIDMIHLTHWGRVTHICVGKLTIIGSDNGLSPERRQAIIWTSAGILLIGPLGTNFSEILIEIQTFSLKKIRLKMLSAKSSSFRLGLNVLTDVQVPHYPLKWMSQIPMPISVLTHWPLGDLKIFFKMSFSNSYPESIPWAIPAKLLSEVCHRTPLMISQHWFR